MPQQSLPAVHEASVRPTELVGAAHQEVTVKILNQSPALSLVEIWSDTVLSLVDMHIKTPV